MATGSNGAIDTGTCSSLLRFVDDFYRPDFGVIHLRREGEQQFALAVRMQAVKFADYRPERPSRRLKNIEVLKQQDAIAGDIEDSTPRSPAARGWNQRAEERFEKMKLNCVASRRNRDGIARNYRAVLRCREWGSLAPLRDSYKEWCAPRGRKFVARSTVCRRRLQNLIGGRRSGSASAFPACRDNFQRTYEWRPPPTRKEFQVEFAV